MALLKCKMCGGDLEITEDVNIAECEYCGTKQTVPVADNEKKLGLFNRANRLRMASEFDKAASVYENIISDFPEEAEAYWGLCLCNYGIEYVDDPATGKKIPTCHRSSFESILDSNDFEMVMENADAVSRKQYRDEAKAIEELRKAILEVSSKEEPYDIFICYKETDEKGDRTIDSVIAQDVYNELTDKGYRVFFSRITLEDKLGQEYEPYIFAALNSAKIMLAFGTDYEYYNAVWVKNEWSRFLQLIARGEKKTLIPCYKNIDAYDMPKEFARLQAQDMGKVGAVQDLLRGIEKIIPKNEPTQSIEKVVVTQNGGTNVEALLKRVFMFLEDRNWTSAIEYCEKVLDSEPENEYAYLGKLLAGVQVRTKEELTKLDYVFSKNNNYQKIKRFGDAGLINELDGYIRKIEERNRKRQEQEDFEKSSKIYESAKALLESNKISELSVAVEKLSSIYSFKDSAVLHEKCLRQLKELSRKISNAHKKYEKLKGVIVSSPNVDYPLHIGISCDGSISVSGKDKYRSGVSSWSCITSASIGEFHAVGLTVDSRALADGDNKYGQCNVSQWKNLNKIEAGGWHTVGLCSDGTAVATGYNEYGQCNVSNWTDIIDIAVGKNHTVGLKSDGTVVATGSNEDGRCRVGLWKNIDKIYAFNGNTVGLKNDGTVVAAGRYERFVKNWENIIDISIGYECMLGLKSDGIVVACGKNSYNETNVKHWENIVAISAKNLHSAGLRCDGTVVATGYNECGQCDVEKWNDIVGISVGDFCTLGVKKDGTVVCAGKDNRQPYTNLVSWKLFDNFDNLEEERKTKISQGIQMARYRAQGLCQHCGGTFKGMFTKKCTNCGREKDY